MKTNRISLGEFSKAIGVAALIGKPIIGLGPPGIGKTDIVKQAVKEYCSKTHHYDNIHSLVDLGNEGPETVIGAYAYEDTGNERFPTAFGFAPSYRLLGMSEPREDGLAPVLHFDEGTCPPPEMVPAINSLMLQHRYGPVMLPDNTLRVMTGNREQDSHTVFTFTPVTANRCMMFEIYASATEWIENYAGPNNLHPWTVGLVAKYRESAFEYDPGRYENCTPRQLKTVSDVLFRMGLDPDSLEYDDNKAAKLSGRQIAMIVSLIGEEQTRNMLLMAYMISKLPLWEDIKVNPSGVPVPDISDPTACYLSAVTVANAPSDVAELNIAMEYIMRLPTNSMLLTMSIWMGESSPFELRDMMQCKNYLPLQRKHSDMVSKLKQT
jgi:hypothetical protein